MSKHNRKDHWKIRNFQNFDEFSLSDSQEILEVYFDIFGRKLSTRWTTVKTRVHERVQKWSFFCENRNLKKAFLFRKLLFDPPNYMFSSKNLILAKILIIFIISTKIDHIDVFLLWQLFFPCLENCRKWLFCQNWACVW